MRKIEDLKASDFPDVDPAKLEEWKTLRVRGTKTMMWAWFGILAVLGLLYLVGVPRAVGAAGYLLFALLFAFSPLLARTIGLGPADRLAKELGLREKDIRAALKAHRADVEVLSTDSLVPGAAPAASPESASAPKQGSGKRSLFRVVYRIWVLLALVFLVWATVGALRPWISYLSAMRNGVSSITYKREGSFVTSSFHHTRNVQTAIEVADYTGSAPIIRRWSASELYGLTSLGVLASLLVLQSSIGLLLRYSRSRLVVLLVSSVVWYVAVAVGHREIAPLRAVAWMLIVSATAMLTLAGQRRQKTQSHSAGVAHALTPSALSSTETPALPKARGIRAASASGGRMGKRRPRPAGLAALAVGGVLFLAVVGLVAVQLLRGGREAALPMLAGRVVTQVVTETPPLVATVVVTPAPEAAAVPTPTSTLVPTHTPQSLAIQSEDFDQGEACFGPTVLEISQEEGQSDLGIKVISGGITIKKSRIIVFCYEARHIWTGTAVHGGYTFASDKDNPLEFQVTRDRGYVYVQGRGAVKKPDGTVVHLDTPSLLGPAFTPTPTGPPANTPTPTLLPQLGMSLALGVRVPVESVAPLVGQGEVVFSAGQRPGTLIARLNGEVPIADGESCDFCLPTIRIAPNLKIPLSLFSLRSVLNPLGLPMTKSVFENVEVQLEGEGIANPASYILAGPDGATLNKEGDGFRLVAGAAAIAKGEKQPAPTTSSSTPPPRPTSSWITVLSDAFDDNRNDWPISSGMEDGYWFALSQQIANGVYGWEGKAKQDVVQWAYPDIRNLTDFSSSVNIRQTGGADDAQAGLVFRFGAEGYYMLKVSPGRQEYTLDLWHNGRWTTLVDWTYTSAIVSEGWNRIEVEAVGSTFTFRINGQAVPGVSDGTLTRGKVGLMIGLPDPGDEAVFEFDDFYVGCCR